MSWFKNIEIKIPELQNIVASKWLSFKLVFYTK